MHSVTPPQEEAERLYVAQSGLRDRLRAQGDELVLWDVGLGAATNAMAAIQCWAFIYAPYNPGAEFYCARDRRSGQAKRTGIQTCSLCPINIECRSPNLLGTARQPRAIR